MSWSNTTDNTAFQHTPTVTADSSRKAEFLYNKFVRILILDIIKKFATALGADVTVLSHSPGKKGDALAMGAHQFVDTSVEASFEECAGAFDVILNTVSAELDINKYLNLLKLDGTLVVIGLPGKPYAVHVGSLLSGRRSIGGSMIGGIPELQEMLNFCGEKSIVSDVEVIKADYINEAYERTVASDVKYRFVIDAKTF